MLGCPVISFMASGHGLLKPSCMAALGEHHRREKVRSWEDLGKSGMGCGLGRMRLGPGVLVPSWRGHIKMQYRLYLGVPSPSTREAGVSRRAARGPSKLSSQRVENSQKKAKKDSRQSLPCLLGLVDVTFVQGALVASCLTQSLMELELDDEADEVPGGEGGVTLSPGCPPPPTAARMSG